LQNSRGLNLGLHYLSGAVTYDPVAVRIEPELASRIVWLDSFLTNIDRTHKNTNLLIWNKELWLIDQGACLYFHYTWTNWKEQALNPFPMISEHVLLPQASLLAEVDQEYRSKLTQEMIREVVELIPDEWLNWDDMQTPQEMREVYWSFLTERLAYSDLFVKEAQDAKAILI